MPLHTQSGVRGERSLKVDERREGLMEFYEQAANEQNPEKRMTLVAERFFWIKKGGGNCYGSGKDAA